MFIKFSWLRILLGISILGCLSSLSIPAAASPRIQQWRLDNGIRVYFVEAHELPMMDLRVVFAAGSAYDGNQPGIAALTNSLLDQGAGEWNADAIAEKLAGLGARLDSDSLRDMAVVGLRSLTEASTLNVAAGLLAAIITNPTFPVDACERGRSQILIALEDEQQSPDSIATKAFYQAIYGNHPYAHHILGSAATVANLTQQDFKDFHRRHYVGNNAVAALVGDLSRSEAEALVTRVLGKLPAGEASSSLPPVAELTSMTLETIPFPATQTHVLSGQPGIRRGDPDYFPFYLGNHILGGSGLISRISEEIREKRGLSYAASSEFVAMRWVGPFIMGLQTRNDKSAEARQVLVQTLEKFVRAGPTPEELLKAQQNITGGFALRLASNHKVVEYLAMIAFYNLPLDYLDRFKANVEAVTVTQIRDSFQRRINPSRLATVVVGGEN